MSPKQSDLQLLSGAGSEHIILHPQPSSDSVGTAPLPPKLFIEGMWSLSPCTVPTTPPPAALADSIDFAFRSVFGFSRPAMLAFLSAEWDLGFCRLQNSLGLAFCVRMLLECAVGLPYYLL